MCIDLDQKWPAFWMQVNFVGYHLAIRKQHFDIVRSMIPSKLELTGAIENAGGLQHFFRCPLLSQLQVEFTNFIQLLSKMAWSKCTSNRTRVKAFADRKDCYKIRVNVKSSLHN